MQFCHAMLAVKTIRSMAIGSLFVFGLAGTAAAVSVPITNHSFESPDVMGAWQDGLPNDWLAGGGLSNRWVENNASVGFSGGDGVQHVGLDTNGGYIYQDLGVAFAANTKYTIDLASAHRDGHMHGIVEFGLFSSDALGTDIGAPGFMDIQGVWNGANPDGDNMWNTFRDASLLHTIGTGSLGKVYSYTTGAVAPAGNLVVFIRDVSGGRETVDNIRLDATAVPEPASMMFAAVAIGSLLAVGGRRK
ncbi:MAG: PEP-CTERM sorting domain-containing protein [Pirellulales bacterium]